MAEKVRFPESCCTKNTILCWRGTAGSEADTLAGAFTPIASTVRFKSLKRQPRHKKGDIILANPRTNQVHRFQRPSR